MTYRIGQVARLLGMTVEGLRFYERRGLVKPARRPGSGYRIYGEQQLADLRFIRAAQEMGFSLREIQELLRLREGRASCCRTMRDRLETKRTTVRHRIALLRRFEKELAAAVQRCDAQVAAGLEGCCPVLDELGRSWADFADAPETVTTA